MSLPAVKRQQHSWTVESKTRVNWDQIFKNPQAVVRDLDFV